MPNAARYYGHLTGVNNYVKAMAMDAAMRQGPLEFSLGSPAAVDADEVSADIATNATAGTEVAISWTSVAKFGQSLRLSISGDPGAATSVMDIYGRDWVGQPMVERFTVANGSTAIQYGRKAFKTVTKSKIVTASTNAVVMDVGTGMRLGLPFRGDVVWAKENASFVALYKRDVTYWRHIAGASLVGGPSGSWLYADFPGFVKTLRGHANMPVGSTNDPAITVELATVAITGLTVTIDVSAAATAALVSDTPTTAGYSANNRFRPGDLIEIVASDADAAVGGVEVGLELTPTQVSLPDNTDPGTVTTGDPRGTYEPLLTLDGSEIVVGLLGDAAVNASGNGGLMGIKHYHP